MLNRLIVNVLLGVNTNMTTKIFIDNKLLKIRTQVPIGQCYRTSEILRDINLVKAFVINCLLLQCALKTIFRFG